MGGIAGCSYSRLLAGRRYSRSGDADVGGKRNNEAGPQLELELVKEVCKRQHQENEDCAVPEDAPENRHKRYGEETKLRRLPGEVPGFVGAGPAVIKYPAERGTSKPSLPTC
jgi:hypothetical protein